MEKVDEKKSIEVIQQKTNCKIKIEVASVDWLVENTMVNKFRIDNGEIFGYQRETKESHINKIIEYIETNEFYFPSCIICSNPCEGSSNKQLLDSLGKRYFVVDGQHRIEAFRKMKHDPNLASRYNEIKDYTVPLTILDQVDEKTEISTFITINKTGRKVDTSLALILQNKMNEKYLDENGAKVDYLAVELARKMNEDVLGLWYKQIAFGEKSQKKNYLLSLNAFVKSIRRNIKMLNKCNVIDLQQLKTESVDENVNILFRIQNIIWACVKNKWPDLFCSDDLNKSVIIETIGFTSINKYVASEVNCSNANENMIKMQIEKCFDKIDCKSDYWKKSGVFATYSSESGYSKIVRILKGEEENPKST